jgi:aminomethyltransferase
MQYKGTGTLNETRHTRSAASLFDVSHLGVIKVTGPMRAEFLEKAVISDVKELPEGRSILSYIMNKEGGIVDECTITNMGEYLSIIVNGACRHKDWAFLLKAKLNEYADADDKVGLELYQEDAIVALQGPRAAEVLQAVLGTSLDLSKMSFLDSKKHNIKKISSLCTISRCGYTGEDGFEIMVPKEKAIDLSQILLNEKAGGSQQIVKMAGLSCRDTLRQECGLCLYGHELHENIGLVEANHAWVIGKRRRKEGGFYGWEIVKKQLTTNVPMRLCGFVTEGTTAREQHDIFNQSGERVGYITSGAYSPTLKVPIGMAYVKVPLHKVGTRLVVSNREVMQPLTIHKLPFIKTKYYRVKK